MKFPEVSEKFTIANKEFHEFSRNLAIAAAFLILGSQISAGKLSVGTTLIPKPYLHWAVISFGIFLLVLNGITVALKLFSLFSEGPPSEKWGQFGWSIVFYSAFFLIFFAMIDVTMSMTFVAKN